MRKLNLSLFVAAFALFPLAGRAATIVTFSYDVSDMQVSSDGGNTFSPAAFTPATNTVTVPVGDIVEFGVDVTVTGNPNPAATGTTGSATYNFANQDQPANLGLASYGFGMNDTKPAVASVVDASAPGGTTTSLKGAAAAAWDTFRPGTVDDVGGGISGSKPESGGVSVGNHIANGTPAANQGFFGVGASGAAELLNELEIQTGVAGTAVFTPTDQVGPGLLGLVEYLSGGTTISSVPLYTNHTVTDGDGNTVNNLPPLTVVVGIPEPASAGMLFAVASGLMLRRRKPNA